MIAIIAGIIASATLAVLDGEYVMHSTDDVADDSLVVGIAYVAVVWASPGIITAAIVLGRRSETARHSQRPVASRRTHPPKRVVFIAIWAGIATSAVVTIPLGIFILLITSSLPNSREVVLASMASQMALPGIIMAVTIIVLGGKRRKRKPPLGRCRKCGYDLTGNVSGICPECGQEAP